MTLANRSTDSHLPRRTTPRHSTPRRTTPRHSTPRHAAPRRITPRHNSIPLCSRGDVGVGPSLHELCTSLGGSGAQYLKQQLQEESSTGQRWYVTSNEGTTLLTTFTGGDLEARHAKAAAGATDTKRADRIFNAIEAPCPALSKSPIRFERTFFYADGSANVAHADAVESYIAKTHQPKLVEVRESRIVAHQFIRRNWQVQNNTRSTDRPTNQPTNRPTDQPTNQPTDRPTNQPTNQPTNRPTNRPTDQPTNQPTDRPTNRPTDISLLLNDYAGRRQVCTWSRRPAGQ